MLFELKYLDDTNGTTIPISPDETTTLGRGKIHDLQIDDRRISRNHCEISTMAGQLYLKSMHTNPCFIEKSSDKKRHLIHKNESIRLEIGDKFSLLPDSHSFLVCQPSNKQQLPSASGVANSTAVLDETLAATTTPVPAKRKLPAWMVATASSCSPTKQQNNKDLLDTQPYNFEDVEKQPESPVCTCVKDEVVDPASQPQQVTVTSQQRSPPPPSPPPQPAPQPDQSQKQRIRCQYGRSCYRKNPVHFAQFCHPGDADYNQAGDVDVSQASGTSSSNSGECPPCRYGTQCYRQNPQHRLEYSHPPSSQTAPPNRRQVVAQQQPQQTYDDDEEEEAEEEEGDVDYEPEEDEEVEAEEEEDRETDKTSSTDLVAQSGDDENND